MANKIYSIEMKCFSYNCILTFLSLIYIFFISSLFCQMQLIKKQMFDTELNIAELANIVWCERNCWDNEFRALHSKYCRQRAMAGVFSYEIDPETDKTEYNVIQTLGFQFCEKDRCCKKRLKQPHDYWIRVLSTDHAFVELVSSKRPNSGLWSFMLYLLAISVCLAGLYFNLKVYQRNNRPSSFMDRGTDVLY